MLVWNLIRVSKRGPRKEEYESYECFKADRIKQNDSGHMKLSAYLMLYTVYIWMMNSSKILKQTLSDSVLWYIQSSCLINTFQGPDSI